jgi:ABC-type transporter Mla subunit MlaD
MEAKHDENSLSENMDAAVESAAAKAHASVDRAADKIDAAADKMDAAADDLNDRIGEISERLKADGERLLASACELGDVLAKQTRQHPLTACGIAFVAGIAVARLIRR